MIKMIYYTGTDFNYYKSNHRIIAFRKPEILKFRKSFLKID